MSQGNPQAGERIWDSPREVGNPFSSVGNTPIAVLAGFSLTALITVTGRKRDAWSNASVILFTLSVIFFIAALLFITAAAQYTATPAERLARVPEAYTEDAEFKVIRDNQWKDEGLLDLYSKRISFAMIAGILTTLTGASFLFVSSRIGNPPLILLLAFSALVMIYYLQDQFAFIEHFFLLRPLTKLIRWLFPDTNRRTRQPVTDGRRDLLH